MVVSAAEMVDAARSFSLVAALDTGLLAGLQRGESPDRLADVLGLDPTASCRVAELLGLCDLLQADDPDVDGARQCMEELEETERFVWGHLEHFLRTGQTLFERVGGRERAYEVVTPRLGALFESDAKLLAALLPPVGTVLDVGAGSGVWSLAMAEREPTTRVTALDFDRVLPRFFERALNLGLADRVDTIAGSYLDVDLPHDAFDRIVIANVLHLEQPAVARTLLRRVWPSLRVGGTLIVCDAFSLGGLDEERVRAAYALHLAMRVRGGFPHRQADVVAWLLEAGASSAELVENPGATTQRAFVTGRAG